LQTYISILRGVNLGGINSLKMAALKDLLLQKGFGDVETYIQSGNVVYRFPEIIPEMLSQRIREALHSAFGLEVPVITLSLPQLETVVENNPFLKEAHVDTAFLHVTFLDGEPHAAGIEKLKSGAYEPDAFEVLNKAVYLHCPKGYGNTKLSNKFLETKLKVAATTRNWKTTVTLLEMARRKNAR